MAKKAGIDHTQEIPSSHSPFLSMPDKVVEFIRGIVEESYAE